MCIGHDASICVIVYVKIFRIIFFKAVVLDEDDDDDDEDDEDVDVACGVAVEDVTSESSDDFDKVNGCMTENVVDRSLCFYIYINICI